MSESAWAAQIGSRRYWSGAEDLAFETETWRAGGQLLRVGRTSDDTKGPDRRVRLQLVDPDLDRAWLAAAPGPERVEIIWLRRSSPGVAWGVLKRAYGRLGRVVRLAGVWEAEIEPRGALARRRPRRWSHTDQVAAHPGDRGLEYMAGLAEGISVIWPPAAGSETGPGDGGGGAGPPGGSGGGSDGSEDLPDDV